MFQLSLTLHSAEAREITFEAPRGRLSVNDMPLDSPPTANDVPRFNNRKAVIVLRQHLKPALAVELADTIASGGQFTVTFDELTITFQRKELDGSTNKFPLELWDGVVVKTGLRCSRIAAGAGRAHGRSGVGMEPNRLQRMRLLLREGADALLEPSPESSNDDAVTFWKVLRLLQNAFRHHVYPDFQTYMESQGSKYGAAGSLEDGLSGKPYRGARRAAQYLRDLANRLNPTDLDEGFHLPDDLEQYDPFNWPDNKPTP